MEWAGISQSLSSPKIETVFSPQKPGNRSASKMTKKVPFADVTNGAAKTLVLAPAPSAPAPSAPASSAAVFEDHAAWDEWEESCQQSDGMMGEAALYMSSADSADADFEREQDELWLLFESGAVPPVIDDLSLQTAEPLRALLSGVTLLAAYVLIVAATTWHTFYPEGELTAAPAILLPASRIKLLLDSWEF